MTVNESTPKKILLLGYGDLAQRLAPHFLPPNMCENHFQITAVARSEKAVSDGVHFWQGSIANFVANAPREKLASQVAVFTLTPGGRREIDYITGYLNNVRLMLDAWRRIGHKPDCVIFVSSSSVYGQNSGEWVNEESDTFPEKDTAKVLLKTEALLRDSGISSCALRFSGIYGPGRYFLIRQVAKGILGDLAYTNRIHAEDCAGIIAFLIQRFYSDNHLPKILIGSDCKAVGSQTVRQWIAKTLNEIKTDFSLTDSSGETPGTQGSKRVNGMNKRCDNSRLINLGYRFRYPSYKEGFPELIREFLASQD